MFQFHEKQNSSKRHITKLNLNLQLGVNSNLFNNINSNINTNNNLGKANISDAKKWNLFSPKVPEKKYAFDFLVNKNSKLQNNLIRKSGLELFLKLNNKQEKNKNEALNNEEFKKTLNNDSIQAKPDASKNLNFEKFKNFKDQSINNTIEDGNVINPEEIYNMSIVNK